MPRTGPLPLVHALRALRRQPGLAAVIVLTLAVAIGANTTLFSALNAVLLQPLPYPQPERLVMGRATFSGRINPTMAALDYYDYRDRCDTFASLAATTGFPWSVTVTGRGEPERVDALFASWDLFATLRVAPELGRSFSPEEGVAGAEPVAMVSHGFWRRRLDASPAAVGSTLSLDGTPHTVVGVMPAGFHYLYPVDVWLPMRQGEGWAQERRFHNWLAVGRLAPGVSVEEAQAQADVVSKQLQLAYPESNKDKAMLVTPLNEVLAQTYRPSLLLLMAAVALVLLIACANVAGLLLAQGAARRPEMAVRATLGATRGRLTVQLMAESLMLALAAGLAGVALAYWLRELLLLLLPLSLMGITRLPLDAPVLLFALGLTLATSLLFGLVPALKVSRTEVARELKSGYRVTDLRGTARLRAALVVLQVALSVVLLVGSALLLRSFTSLRRVDPGFHTQGILTAEIGLPRDEYPKGAERVLFLTQLLEETRALPGVVGASVISQLPVRDPGNNIYVYPAESPPATIQDAPTAYQRIILPGYFETLGIPLLAGRGIEAMDNADSDLVIVIDRTMADLLFPDQSPLGRRVALDVGDDPPVAQVVGVVAEVRTESLSFAPFPTMYFSYRQRPTTTMRLAVRTAAEPTSLVPALRRILRKLNRGIPLAEVETMESLLAGSLAERRVVMGALTIFALVALLLAIVGVYGVLAYFVGRRRHEIGVRLALGARRETILGWVLLRGLALVAAGLALGIAASLAATRLIREQLYAVEATDPAALIGASALLAAVALVACLLPGTRATRVDPATALRTD